jgi:16S rRNA (cytosine1407-C5)-methyltransferase
MPGGEPLREEPALYCLPRSAGVARTAAAGCGSIYIQNPSSYVAAKVLRPQPGEEVLDLAAAPGGKTIAMAAMMNNQGRIAAVEPVRGRFHHLRANVARCGVRIAEFYQKDGRKVGALVPQRFDRVLLDAPCSSESRMRWSEPDTYRHWSLKKVKECQRKQKGLLRSAFESLKPGGRLLYCTCSFGPEENELVVAHLLRRSTAVLLPVTVAAPKQVAGLTAWRGKALPADMARTVRILPDQCWDGFFLALLCRPSAE